MSKILLYVWQTVVLDQTLYSAASDLGLHCLQRPTLFAKAYLSQYSITSLIHGFVYTNVTRFKDGSQKCIDI